MIHMLKQKSTGAHIESKTGKDSSTQGDKSSAGCKGSYLLVREYSRLIAHSYVAKGKLKDCMTLGFPTL